MRSRWRNAPRASGPAPTNAQLGSGRPARPAVNILSHFTTANRCRPECSPYLESRTMRHTAAADVIVSGHRELVDSGRSVLAQCGLFRRLSDGEREALFARARTQRYAANESIF